MNEITVKAFKSHLGELVIGSYKEYLVLCDWKYRRMRKAIDDRISKGLAADFMEGTSQVIEKTIAQLTEYFSGNRTDFDLSIKFVGTDFQKQVWTELQTIPFGETRSYLALSQTLGNEKAIRAVASANGANAISIVVPCHRIIGSNGEMTGYAGGLKTKERLLKLEGAKVANQMNLFD